MSINDSLSDLATTLATELPLLRAAVSVADLAGASWPDAPAVGQLRFRTDLGLLCYYDGARWLTANEYEANFSTFSAHPLTATYYALHYAARSDYSYYITNSTILIVLGAVNNATDYWRFGFVRGNVFIQEHSSASYAPSTRVLAENTINAVYNPPAVNTEAYGLLVFRMGAASNLHITGTFRYRLVIP